MTVTNEKREVRENENALTAAERTEIWEFFISIVNEMKKHGLPDVGLLKKAYLLASKEHGDTRRKTGEPYIMHPLCVAKILADGGHESDMVAAAILHDIVEDCKVTVKDLEREFGVNIADTVDAVTKVSAMFAPDEEMSKRDLDDLSDIKFLTEISDNKKAVYIKCADRIHNLRTISIFPEEQQKAKAYHTRNIIIPAAKMFHIHNLVDILGTLCLEIEDPVRFREINSAYKEIFAKNRDTLFGNHGLIEETRRMVFEDGRLGRYVADLDFSKRCTDSLYGDLSDKLENANEIRAAFTKDAIPLYDVYFIVSDLYMGTPENLFFGYYDRLHESKYRFTIIDIHEDEYESYYLMKDRYGNRYRLFVQSETEHLEFTHGLLVSAELNDFRNGMGYVNTAEPGAPVQKMIPVFKKDGSQMAIAEGATVLDFAFAIDPNIGICAKYAHLNGSTTQTPIYTRLKPGDQVEIVSDHNKHDQANDVPHATVRWFEYLHTREATRNLSRWLEKHMDSAVPTMMVYDGDGKEYEIEMASTVLDFAFVVDEEIGLHIQRAFINKSQTPAELDKTLRYGDEVRFEYDPADKETPVFTWLSIVKTKQAKERLIAYFNQKFQV